MRTTITAALSPVLLTVTLTAQWAQVTPVVEPSARGDVAMCDFPATGGVLLFGGNTLTFPNAQSDETWGYDGTTWTNLAPATTPLAAGGARLVHDSTRGVAVLFGGLGNSPISPPVYNRTWEFNGVDWTDVTPVPSPNGRHSHAMAFDVARNVTVMFGGEPGGLLIGGFADTWEFDGATGTWTQVAATSTPGPRTKHAMCYALTAGACVMFGGFNPLAPGGAFSDETWLFDGTSWTTASVTGARPQPRFGAEMVYDSTRAVCVLTGGLDTANLPLNDTWEYDPVTNTWTPLLTTYTTGRRSMGLAYDLARATTVMFGGITVPATSTVPGTWELSTRSLAFGSGCAGSNGVPTLDAIDAPRFGQTYTLNMTGLNTTFGLGVIAFSNFKLTPPLDLGLLIGMTGCTGYVPADALETVVGAGGNASWSVLMPTTPGLLGATIVGQLFSFDQGINAFGFVSSNAHIGTLGN